MVTLYIPKELLYTQISSSHAHAVGRHSCLWAVGGTHKVFGVKIPTSQKEMRQGTRPENHVASIHK